MRPLLLLALACHLFFSGGAALVTPAFEGPDENDHYYYAHLLAHRGLTTLPIILRSEALGAESPWREASLGHHPPLYYQVLALLLHAFDAKDTAPSWSDQGLEPDGPHKWRHGSDEIAPVSPEIRLLWRLRAFSVLCGLVSLLLVHRLGLSLFPSRPQIADLGTLCLACLPQWGFMHGVLDNGNLATTLCLAVLLVLCRASRGSGPGVAAAVALGLLTGLALITKLTALFLLPLLAFAFLFQGFRAVMGETPRPRLAVTCRAGLVALLLICAVAGWFFVRNQGLYGEWLGSSAHRQAFASNVIPDALRSGYFRTRLLPETLLSFVGHFGWGRVAVPPAVLTGVQVAMAISLLGWVLARIRRTGSMVDTKGQMLLCSLTIGLVTASFLHFNKTFFQPQGRYLFPAAGPMFLFFAAGFVMLCQQLPATRWNLLLRAAAVLVPVCSSAAVFLFVLVPGLSLEQPTASGRDASRYASLHGGITKPAAPDRITIRLLGPAEGAEQHEAPTFQWQAGTLPPDTAFTLHAFLADGRILFGTFETAGFALRGQQWTIPEPYFAMLPAHVPIHWKVRRLPERSLGETIADVESSAVGTFTIRR